MRVCLNRWLHLMLISTLWLSPIANASPGLRAVCDDLKGSETRYGSSLWELDDGTIETSPTEYPGAQLIFHLEPDQPRTLMVMWRQSPAAFDIADDRSQPYNANIVLNTASQLTAIHHHVQAVWMYSIFPKLRIAYISFHSHFPLGYDSRSTSIYAICHITDEAL